jgi:hypothetical protein
MWRVYAHELHDASVALITPWLAVMWAWSEKSVPLPDALPRSFTGPAVMLRAMACECYLKALGLQRGKFVLAVGGRFNRKIVGLKNQHDLVSLARLVEFKVSPEEEEALKGLSRSISTGRYPIPLHWSEAARLTSDGRIDISGSSGWGWDSVGDGIMARLIQGHPPKPSQPATD